MPQRVSSGVRAITTARPHQSPRSTAHFTAEEKRKIFRGMVVAELEAGFLRYSRRQALLEYAAKLGIAEFEALLLMAEAQYRVDEIEPCGFDSVASLENMTRPDAWSIPLRLSAALLAAIAIDLLLIWRFFN